MIERALRAPLLAALADTPVVVLAGARQTGKSTLAMSLAESGYAAQYVTLDDPTELAGARTDPAGFISRFHEPVIIDEIQRAPEILLPIKASIDRDRSPGRFLLTGSANVLFVPSVAEALAGRMAVLTLWPFSNAELEGRPPAQFMELLFDREAQPPVSKTLGDEELVERLLAGGFPEAVERSDPERRRNWFFNYLTTILERDVRTMSDVAWLESLPALLSAVGLRSRGPLNKSGISQDLGIPNSSIDRYLVLLERVFLVRRISAWHNRVGPRLVKAPKMLVSDPGLLCQLLRLGSERLLDDSALRGQILESYVGMELVKAAGASDVATEVLHYRTTKGVEVDFLVESADGRIAGVEVKGGRSVDAHDFRRFDRLEEILGNRFARGLVLYTGERPVNFGENRAAWPLGLL